MARRSEGNNGARQDRSFRARLKSRFAAARNNLSSMSKRQVQDWVDELQAQQLELETQNEQLREKQLAIARSRDTYIDLYEYSPTGYLLLDGVGVILAANLTASSLLGQDRRMLIGKRLSDFVASNSQDALFNHLRAVILQSDKQAHEIDLRRPDDDRVAVLLESRLHENNGPKIQTTLTEITRLKQAEEELESFNKLLEERIDERTRELERANASLRAEVAARRASEDFNRTVIDTAQTIILVLDLEGRIVSFNRYLEQLGGRKLEDVQGKFWFDVYLPEKDRVRVQKIFDTAISGKPTRGNRNSIITASGVEHHIEWYDAILRDQEGKEIGLLSVGQDISDQILLEQQILTVADEEQRRIGQQLHDDIGQELVGLKLRMDTLAASLEEQAPALVAAGHRISRAIENTIVKVRALSRGLIPVKVNGEEMIASLTELAQQIREIQRIDCQFIYGPGLEDLSEERATQLFHIVQEAVTNAIKHAEAQRIQISIECENGIVEMRVHDEGKGFKLADEIRGSGLTIMEHRAARIGGSLSVESVPGDGTLIRCRVPRAPPGATLNT